MDGWPDLMGIKPDDINNGLLADGAEGGIFVGAHTAIFLIAIDAVGGIATTFVTPDASAFLLVGACCNVRFPGFDIERIAAGTYIFIFIEIFIG